MMSAVVPESPAGKAGLKEKDIVLTMNGRKLDADHPIQDFLENMDVGSTIELHRSPQRERTPRRK